MTERLPYVDEHSRTVDAPPERTWPALVAVCTDLGRGAAGPLGRLLGLDPRLASGEWSGPPASGDTVRGFAVEQASPPARLALAGRHRFSRYALVFDLEPAEAGRTRIRARSWAAFPSLHGRAYRALVIGTGGHRIAVRRLLQRIADHASERG